MLRRAAGLDPGRELERGGTPRTRQGGAEKGEEVIQFRWHLGTDDPVRIEGTGSHFTITWPGAKMTLLATTPLTVSPGNHAGQHAEAQPLAKLPSQSSHLPGGANDGESSFAGAEHIRFSMTRVKLRLQNRLPPALLKLSLLPRRRNTRP